MSETIDRAGQIITWEVLSSGPTSARITVDEVRRALKDCGLEPKDYARDFLPSDGLKRALGTLIDEQVFNVIGGKSTDVELCFQITPRADEGNKVVYKNDESSYLYVNRSRGNPTVRGDASNHEARDRAQALLDKAMQTRTGSDITAIVQRIFRNSASGKKGARSDLMPLKSNGGVYFVAGDGLHVADQAQKFLEAVGGVMRRIDIGATESTNVAVASAVENGINGMISELEHRVDGFSEKTRKSTMTNCADKADEILAKIEAYRDYLVVEGVERLGRALDSARSRITAAILQETEVGSSQYDDA